MGGKRVFVVFFLFIFYFFLVELLFSLFFLFFLSFLSLFVDGPLGVQGRIGWYTPDYLVNANDDFSNWRSLL